MLCHLSMRIDNSISILLLEKKSIFCFTQVHVFSLHIFVEGEGVGSCLYAAVEIKRLVLQITRISVEQKKKKCVDLLLFQLANTTVNGRGIYLYISI